jgi:hypothetical protein
LRGRLPIRNHQPPGAACTAIQLPTPTDLVSSLGGHGSSHVHARAGRQAVDGLSGMWPRNPLHPAVEILTDRAGLQICLSTHMAPSLLPRELFRLSQESPAELDASQGCVEVVWPYRICGGHRTLKVGAGQVCMLDVGSGQVRTLEIGIAEVRVF